MSIHAPHSPRRHNRCAIRQSNRKADSEIALLSAEERTVRDRIADLERFIVKAPELAERAHHAQRERLNTLPPPDEFLPDESPGFDGRPGGSRPRLTRAQAARRRRHRTLNLATFIGVALVLAAFGLWIAECL